MEKTPEERYNRERMLEIRAMIRQSLKDEYRIDQQTHLMDMDDIKRVIIALQDTVTDSQARHKKATRKIQVIVEQAASIDKSRWETINAQSRNNASLRTEREIGMQTIRDLRQGLAEKTQTVLDLNMDVNNLVMENEQLQRRVEALLSTISIMSEGMA